MERNVVVEQSGVERNEEVERSGVEWKGMNWWSGWDELSH